MERSCSKDGSSLMHTSKPTTPTDVATLITGDTQAKSSALLKGVYATLSHAKATPSDTGSSTGSDFASLLDSPESEGNSAEEQNSSEGTGRCVLATELNVMRYGNKVPIYAVSEVGKRIMTARLEQTRTPLPTGPDDPPRPLI